MGYGKGVREELRVPSRELRLVDALQAADTHKVATPANWRPGDAVIVPTPVTTEQAAERVADGYECVDWYLCTKKV